MPRPGSSRGTTGRPPAVPEFSFDSEFYRRYYGDRATRVADPETCALLADFVFAYLAYLRLPVERVLDVGCGVGLWRREVLRHRPRAQYVGVETSEYACRKYGWEQGSLTSYRPAEEFDLVICQDVFQYLDDAEAEAAIRNLPNLSRAAFYLQILTREDWEHACDRRITDGDVHLRPATWYRRRLRHRLVTCGGGIFLAKGAPAVLYELERLA